jgi:hypothetical protein
MLLRRAAASFPLTTYLGSILLITAIVTGLILWRGARLGLGPWGLLAVGSLLLIAASQLAVALVHWVATLLVRPRILPRMDYAKGVPSEHRTVVAVPTMLTDAREIDDLLEALEVRFLANRDENISFALLGDFRDAADETTPADAALLERARDGIRALNARYGGQTSGDAATMGKNKVGGNGDQDDAATRDRRHTRGDATQRGYFFLFHRARRWNAAEGVWMGWERKRGKLEQFNAALRGDASGFDTVVGPVGRLQGVRYVITLDSDTQLPRDSARELVGTLAHPLNRPCYDERLGRVTAGYAILQPRVGVSMPSAARSRFARLFAGDAGIDPYTRAVSDVYQDLFGEGSFIGKGIYDVDALGRAIGAASPKTASSATTCSRARTRGRAW